MRSRRNELWGVLTCSLRVCSSSLPSVAARLVSSVSALGCAPFLLAMSFSSPAPKANASSPASGCGDSPSLSKFAQRVPKPKKSSDAMENNRRDLTYKCKVNIVDWCEKNEDQLMALWTLIQTGGVAAAMAPTKPNDDGGRFFATAPKVVRAIDRQWKAQFIVDRMPRQNNFDSARMRAMDQADEKAVDECFEFVTSLGPHDVLPATAKEKHLLAKVLDKRIGDLRLALRFDTVAKAVGPTGILDWSQITAYRFVFANGKATELQHDSGASVRMPDHVVITSAFRMAHGAHDLLTTCSLSMTTHQLAHFFVDGDGPKRSVLDKKGTMLKAMFDVQSEAQADSSSSASYGQSAVVLANHAELKRKAALEKARNALASRPKKCSRRITMLAGGGGAAEPAPLQNAAGAEDSSS